MAGIDTVATAVIHEGAVIGGKVNEFGVRRQQGNIGAFLRAVGKVEGWDSQVEGETVESGMFPTTWLSHLGYIAWADPNRFHQGDKPVRVHVATSTLKFSIANTSQAIDTA